MRKILKKNRLLTKITSLIVLFFITSSIYSQTNFKLDQKKGFKDILIGDPFSKWQSKITFKGNSSNGGEIYILNNLKDYNVFNKEVILVKLFFKNQKIIAIEIRTDYYQKKPVNFDKYILYSPEINIHEIDNIISGFNNLFGEYESVSKANPNTTESALFDYKWRGNCISLFLSYCNSINEGSWGSILLVDTCKFDKKDPGF